MHIDSVDTQILTNLNHVFSISISTLFLIFLKNNLFSVVGMNLHLREWRTGKDQKQKNINMNGFTNTWRSFAGCAPDTIKLINFKDCQHRIYVSIDSDQKKGQCVFWRCKRAQFKNTIFQSIGQMKQISYCNEMK